jgi:hypothetical protein
MSEMTAEQIKYYWDLATTAKLGAANPINAAEVRQLLRHIDALAARLAAVEGASRRAMACIAEFPDDPSACREWFDALDATLAAAPQPGTEGDTE